MKMNIFQLNYNMVMLACHYGSTGILNYLIDKVANSNSNPDKIKKDLTHLKVSLGGIQPSHLACFIGNLDMIKILQKRFDVDFGEQTENGLTGLHCAAQRKEGIVSIYYLNQISQNFNPNVTDIFGATPLHYAIMRIQE